MRRTMWVALLAMVVGLGAGAADGVEEEIRKAEKGWAAAVTGNDHAALEGILSTQLIYAHSTGVVETKGEYLGRLRKGAQKYDSIEHQSMTIRTYGNAAVLHATVRMTGKSDTRAFDDRLMMMHLWVKQGGKWQLAAHQTTKLQ